MERKVNPFQQLIKQGKTVVLQQIKTHAIAMVIGLLCLLVAYWIEPLISQEALDILVVSSLTALGVSLWIQLRKPRFSIVCSALAVCFHYCWGSSFVRQIALTALMAGSIIALWSEARYRKSKTKPKI